MEHKSVLAKIKNFGFGKLVGQLVGNDRGVVLIFALVIMLVLTVIGSSSTMTSQVDLKISGNTKVTRTSFYIAEGGIMMAPKVISRIITDRALPALADTPLLAYDTSNLLEKIMGYIETDDPGTDTTDIVMNQGTQGNLALDLTRSAAEYLSGGGVEFAAGTEGVGVAGATNTAIRYNLTSTGTVGTTPRATVAQIAAQYRKVVGVAGGR